MILISVVVSLIMGIECIVVVAIMILTNDYHYYYDSYLSIIMNVAPILMRTTRAHMMMRILIAMLVWSSRVWNLGFKLLGQRA